MKYIKMLSLLASFVISFTLQGQNSLTYNLKKGSVFKVKQHANQIITQKIRDTEHEITNNLTAIYNFKVVDVDEKGFDLTFTYLDFTNKSNSNLQGIVMDVKAKEYVEGDIMSEMFHSVLGHELKMRMNVNGSVVSIEGGDELIKKMITAAGIDDQSTISLVKQSLGKEFSSDGLGKSFEQMTFFYPDTKVSIGDTWENTYNGKLSSNNTFKLEKMEGNVTSISGTAAIVLDNEESGTIMSLSGSQETVIQANTTTGFIQKVIVTSLTKGSTEISQLGNSQTIPTTIESTITYELLEN